MYAIRAHLSLISSHSIFYYNSNILPVSTEICQVFVHCSSVMRCVYHSFVVSTDFGENPNGKFIPTKPHLHNAHRVYLVLSKWGITVVVRTLWTLPYSSFQYLIFMRRSFTLAIISKRDPKFKWHICALFLKFILMRLQMDLYYSFMLSRRIISTHSFRTKFAYEFKCCRLLELITHHV